MCKMVMVELFEFESFFELQLTTYLDVQIYAKICLSVKLVELLNKPVDTPKNEGVEL